VLTFRCRFIDFGLGLRGALSSGSTKALNFCFFIEVDDVELEELDDRDVAVDLPPDGRVALKLATLRFSADCSRLDPLWLFTLRFSSAGRRDVDLFIDLLKSFSWIVECDAELSELGLLGEGENLTRSS